MTDSGELSETYCIVGAGASGLTALKNLREAGIPAEGIEREDDVGGNWYYGRPSSSVYRSAHLISSKSLTEYPDFPMPADWPEYPSQQQVQQYFRAYADHFKLREAIRFNTSVTRIEPADAAATHWIVTLSTGEQRRYRGVIIANGHHWDPNWPQYPGQFHGPVLHSSQYKTPDVLAEKRVLVIGAGNSGCDIAVESGQHAAATFPQHAPRLSLSAKIHPRQTGRPMWRVLSSLAHPALAAASTSRPCHSHCTRSAGRIRPSEARS